MSINSRPFPEELVRPNFSFRGLIEDSEPTFTRRSVPLPRPLPPAGESVDAPALFTSSDSLPESCDAGALKTAKEPELPLKLTVLPWPVFLLCRRVSSSVLYPHNNSDIAPYFCMAAAEAYLLRGFSVNFLAKFSVGLSLPWP